MISMYVIFHQNQKTLVNFEIQVLQVKISFYCKFQRKFPTFITNFKQQTDSRRKFHKLFSRNLSLFLLDLRKSPTRRQRGPQAFQPAFPVTPKRNIFFSDFFLWSQKNFFFRSDSGGLFFTFLESTSKMDLESINFSSIQFTLSESHYN